MNRTTWGVNRILIIGISFSLLSCFGRIDDDYNYQRHEFSIITLFVHNTTDQDLKVTFDFEDGSFYAEQVVRANNIPDLPEDLYIYRWPDYPLDIDDEQELKRIQEDLVLALVDQWDSRHGSGEFEIIVTDVTSVDIFFRVSMEWPQIFRGSSGLLDITIIENDPAYVGTIIQEYSDAPLWLVIEKADSQ